MGEINCKSEHIDKTTFPTPHPQVVEENIEHDYDLFPWFKQSFCLLENSLLFEKNLTVADGGSTPPPFSRTGMSGFLTNNMIIYNFVWNDEKIN